MEIFLKAMRSIKVVSESYFGRSLDMFSFSGVPVGVGVYSSSSVGRFKKKEEEGVVMESSDETKMVVIS